MKKQLLCVVFLFFTIDSFCQKLDSAISSLANDIAQKVIRKNRTRLALTDFVNNDNKTDGLTSYIQQELELKLINADNLTVIDRKHLKLLLSENKLESDGVIDETTAKSSLGFIKVDGWVLAEVNYINNNVKITIKVSDVGTSQIYAASVISITGDLTVNNLLNPPAKICKECGGKGVVQVQTTCMLCNGTGSIACSDCRGTGYSGGISFNSGIKCDVCNGAGKLNCKTCNGNGKIISYKTCPVCNGKVQIFTGGNVGGKGVAKIEICTVCGGSGKIKSQAKCSYCSGTGDPPFTPGSPWQRGSCKYCGGKGEIVVISNCQRCGGSGTIN